MLYVTYHSEPPFTVIIQIITVYVLYYYTSFLTIVLLNIYIILRSLFNVNCTQNLVDSLHSKTWFSRGVLVTAAYVGCRWGSSFAY